MSAAALDQGWARELFEILRRKWSEVPAGDERLKTPDMLTLGDGQLVDYWTRLRDNATTGPNFPVRGWYHTLYRDIFRGKKVMDVGSGLGIDGLTFAQHGARMSFVDIAPSNLDVLRRLTRLLGLEADFTLLESFESLDALPRDFDVIWCQGSMINAPMDLMKLECARLLEHLPVGGRWIELAYPPERWIREGEMPFSKWGEHTDGPGTPWMEWYDLAKLRDRLTPATFDVVLALNFHNDDFNWLDLLRTA